VSWGVGRWTRQRGRWWRERFPHAAVADGASHGILFHAMLFPGASVDAPFATFAASDAGSGAQLSKRRFGVTWEVGSEG